MDSCKWSLLLGSLVLMIKILQETMVFNDSSLPLFSTINALEQNLQALLTSIALHHHVMFYISLVIGSELGHWVKPHSTTWFSHFLLTKYDNTRWIQHFHMSKVTFFDI